MTCPKKGRNIIKKILEGNKYNFRKQFFRTLKIIHLKARSGRRETTGADLISETQNTIGDQKSVAMEKLLYLFFY
jgi:hypothetical protein